jgi:transposase
MRPPSLELRHPEVTRAQLFALARATPGARVGLKIAALLLLLEGQRPGWIAEVLGLTRMTLTRWIHGANADGLAALAPKPRPGRPPRVTAAVRRALAKHLDQSPEAFGLPRVQWDGPTLVVHLERHFGIRLKVRQAQLWLHQLGYRLKRASYSYLQARTTEARAFQRRLKKTPQPGADRDRRLRG